MRLLVGLGNPGEGYAKSRHNLGFVAIDRVAETLADISWKKVEGGLLAEVWLSEKHLLFKPTLFMNRSGLPVRQLMDYYRISSENLCIVADDVYIAPGTVRIRPDGGAGGHNGWKSILEHIEGNDFWRVRIGAGVYPHNLEDRQELPPLDDYVLLNLPPEDRKRATDSIDRLVPNLVEWLKSGASLKEETVHTLIET